MKKIIITNNHLKKSLKALNNEFVTSNHVAYIAATGTGKSIVGISLIQKFGGRALVVVPKLAIAEQWRSSIEKYQMDNVTIETYHKINTVYRRNPEELPEYDFIILDEVHHIGSPMWSKSLEPYFNNSDAKILGLSAEKYRVSDNYQNIVEKYFDGHSVEMWDLGEAIDSGILPTFTYITNIYQELDESKIKNRRGVPKESRAEIKELKKKLTLSRTNQLSITDILHKHIDQYTSDRKILCFVQDIKDTAPVCKVVSGAFPSAHVYTVNNKISDAINSKTIRDFSNDKQLSIMYAIDMFNEGVHLDNIDTIIMFRRTSSSTIWFQQIGRALGLHEKDNPILIFDLQANYINIQRHGMNKSVDNLLSPIMKLNKGISNPENKIIIRDENHEATEIINRIYDIILYKRWTPEEDDVIKSVYPEEGAIGVHKILKHRTIGTIQTRANSLGIRIKEVWSAEDDAYLTEKYPVFGSSCFAQLDNHSIVSCSNRVRHLKLRCVKNYLKDRYPQEVFDIVKEYYPSEGMDCMYRFDASIVIDQETVRSIAKTLKIKREDLSEKWTPEEEEILREYFPIEKYNCVKRLPNRTIDAVRARVRYLDIKYDARFKSWTAEEDTVLLNMFREGDASSFADIAKVLPHRSILAIRRRIHTLGKLPYGKAPQDWTDEEIEILKEYYPKEGLKCVARFPNRTYGSVKTKARKLGITSERHQ